MNARHPQVCFVVSFFMVESTRQTSTCLGFAVLKIPDDAVLSSEVAELSADVSSPDGNLLEGAVCVVDIKVVLS